MKPEKLAEWLRPLMPEQIDAWMQARELADPETRQWIDHQIILTARPRMPWNPRMPRNPRMPWNNLMLSLPPVNVADKPLSLGAIQYDRPRGRFGLSYEQLLQHTAIFGRSGAGKTNVVMNLFRQLIDRGVPVLFLDWKRNAREILPHVTRPIEVYTVGRSLSPITFNPFIAPPPEVEVPGALPGAGAGAGLPGGETHLYIQHVVDVMADAYNLGDGSRRLMQKAIVSATERLGHAPDAKELLHELEQLPEPRGQRGVRGWKATAARALEELSFAQLTSGDAKQQQQFAQKLTCQVSILELDGLSQASRRFLIPLLFSWVYQMQLASSVREKLSLVVILEEAHNVLYRGERSTETLTEQILRQCREIGIGVVLVDQQPNQIASTVLGNVHTSICMNLKDPADIHRAAGLSLLADDEKTYLGQLEIGQGIVKLQTGWQRPFLVQFDHLSIAKGKITDAVLLRLVRGNLTRSALGHAIEGLLPRGSRGRLTDAGFKGMEDQVVNLIHDILSYPSDGVKMRYRRIGVSVGRGNRIKQDLLVLGWITQQVVPIDQTRRTVLKLTPEGERVFEVGAHEPPVPAGVKQPADAGWVDVAAVIDWIDGKRTVGRESLEHAYWKHRYASRLRELGYQVEVEAPRDNGYADIHATGPEGALILEIETGQSDYLSNLKNNLRSDADKIILVATNEKAMQRIERDLATHGLLLPDKVMIVLKDQSKWFVG